MALLVHAIIKDREMAELGRRVYNPFVCTPLQVLLRLRLNELGIQFVGDDRLSSLFETEPVPLGNLRTWYDVKNQETHFEQLTEE